MKTIYSPLDEAIFITNPDDNNSDFRSFTVQQFINTSHQSFTRLGLLQREFASRNSVLPLLLVCNLDLTERSNGSNSWRFLVIPSGSKGPDNLEAHVIKHALGLLPYSQMIWITTSCAVTALVLVGPNQCEALREDVASKLGLALDRISVNQRSAAFCDPFALKKKPLAATFEGGNQP